MGMSASQARLLSITARLTNNEFRGQTITNSKLRLATESEEASTAYMNALQSQKLQYMFYDDNGNAQKLDLTPAVIYEYSPLKNQYALRNASGKILVTNEDAANFNETENLLEFLGRYGLTSDKINKNYEAEMAEYYVELAQYNTNMENYATEYANWQEEYNAWLQKRTDNEIVYQNFVDNVGTSQNPKAYCYEQAINEGDDGCYLHLLNEILDFDGESLQNHTYNTSYKDPSTGRYDTIETNGQKGRMWENGTHDDEVPLEIMKAISDALNNDNYLCDGADRFVPYYNNDGQNDKLEGNLIQEAIDSGRTPNKYEILASDYIYDPDTNSVAGVKTLKQQAIDMYYLIEYLTTDDFKDENGNLIITDEIKKNLLINFTEGDLKGLQQNHDPMPEEPARPVPPEEPSPLFAVRDQDKAQWYTNLWFMMNGSDSANLVTPINSDNETFSNLDEALKQEYRFQVDSVGKNATTANFEVFDESLYSSSTWLQFALEHGVITLDRAQYADPSENSGKTSKPYADAITWESIPYTSAVDIIKVDDEKRIAIAEVKYKKAITEIENKDKKLDQDLKKLDTEHNALMTEYESIKEQISKNVERSFKAFS